MCRTVKRARFLMTCATLVIFLFSLSVSVLADDAPRILSDLSGSLSIPVGGAFTLKIEVQGADLQYQWYKDGSPIDGESTDTISVNNAGETNAGQYSCYVQNPYGGVLSSTCNVIILDRPTLVQDINITSLTLNVGDTITLSAQASGTHVSAQWYMKKGETDIREISGQNGNTLSVTATEEYNGTEIYCQFVNEAGGTVTSSCSVTINPAPSATPEPVPPVITKNPTGEIVTEGGSAIFIARASGASSIMWRLISADGGSSYDYNNTSISSMFPGLVISGGTAETLTLSSIPREMDGWRVACLFRGDGGETLSAEAFLRVNQGISTISIITQPVGGTMGIDENPNFTLSIQATSNSGGQFNYQWFSSATGTSTSMRPISGASSSVYKPERLEGTIYYRVSVSLTTNGVTSEPYYSNTVSVTFTAQKTHEHSYSTAWEHNDLSHWHQCTCGDHGDESLHAFEWDVLNYPTAEKDGQQKGVCSVCGYETIQPIPAGSMTPPPSETTDASSARHASGRGWLTALVLIIAAAVIGTAVYLILRVLRSEDEEDVDCEEEEEEDAAWEDDPDE